MSSPCKSVSVLRLPAFGALAMAAALLGACQPSVALKRPETFQANVTKTYLWEDRCGLQGFFDGNPPANEALHEQSVEAGIARLDKQERGRVAHRISHPRQRHMLQRLLQRFYRSAPRVTGSEPVVVEVGYYRFCGRARALVGSDVRLRIGEREVELAYHPCVGEYLLNGDLYAYRRKLMTEGEIQVAKTPGR